MLLLLLLSTQQQQHHHQQQQQQHSYASPSVRGMPLASGGWLLEKKDWWL